jgi:hypothetical protein
MNGDGHLDVAAFGGGRFGLWLGDGAGGWSEGGGYTTPSRGHYAAFRVGGDVDHNGLPDIVQVADEGGPFNSRNVLRVFLESSRPLQRSARLVRPTAGAVLRGGSVRFIEWASTVPGEVPKTVRLGYSFGGPEGPWTVLAEGLRDSGRYQWVVPEASEPKQLTLGLILDTPDSRSIAIGPELTLLPGH